MKKAILFLIFTAISFSQEPMGEKQSMDDSHIDFTKQFLFFTIWNDIEFDGHIIANRNDENPFIFSATIDGVKIHRKNDPNTEYERRKCSAVNCSLIHLEKKGNAIITFPRWNGYITPLNQIDGGILN